MSPYCAGKFALEGLSESLYYELLPFNIRIKLVEPGGIKTRFKQVFAKHDAYHPDLRAVEALLDRNEGPDSPLPGPDSVAEIVFKAAIDRTKRLRYPVETQGASLLHRVMPEPLWRFAIAKSFGVSRRGSSSRSRK
jgi:NAD(P)-dependent dehydrogenase (short-subunit alcohol dehydrogenase family)